MTLKVTKYLRNPILYPLLSENSFEKASIFNPAAIVKDNKVFLIYRAEEDYYKNYISRLGLAVSEDGFNFRRYSGKPILEENPKEPHEKQGCEDPRIVKITDSDYFLTYVSYGGAEDIQLRGANSKDLVHFEKIGQLVKGREKSGAIIQDYKYKGQYVMYFGDKVLHIAYSRDLKNWKVVTEPVLTPRKNEFDNCLVEGGPPPIVTDEGIFMIYNSAKEGKAYKTGKKWLSYSPGFAIFDKQNPAKLLFRSDKPIMEAEEYWEKYGKVNYVIFATGLVEFKGKWLLYYGGADKSIGVAEIKF